MARNRRLPSKKDRPAVNIPPQLLHNIATVLAGSLLLIALVWSVVLLMDRPIKSIRVVGSFERVTALQVEAALRNLGDKGFLSIKLNRLRKRVEALPWVDEAVMGRSWPGELVVNIVEQVPAARWRDRGLLNTRGELFIEDARHIPAELPRLRGPVGSERRVAEIYLEMRDELARAGHSLAAVRLDERGAWQIELGDGLDVRIGREHRKVRFARFLNVVSPLLAGRNDTAAHVDLRYGRGFAIAWTANDKNQGKEKKGINNDV
jgi:cell division protein FtsQ